jgi:ComF family protein
MLRWLVTGFLDLVYPKTCVACKAKLKDASNIDGLICTPCWSKIKRNLPPFCHSCGRHLEKNYFHKGLCPSCVRARVHFDRAFSPCVYDGVVKELIHNFKYKGKDYLGITLSKFLIEFIYEYNLPVNFIDLIVPIPLHETRLREREFNQAHILGLHIAREFKKDISSNHLIRHRYTLAQAELDTPERMENIKGSFSVTQKEEIKGKNILLIDDVLTSGATCSEAACVLKDAGANIVFALTLAN